MNYTQRKQDFGITHMSTEAATNSVYSRIDATKAPVVAGIVTRVRMSMRHTVKNIIEIGQELISAKNILGHGLFGEWLNEEFEWSASTAGRYMRVATRFPDIRHVDGFEPSVLYTLSSPSATPEAIDEVLAVGPSITVAEAKEIVDRHNEPTESTGEQFDEADFGDESEVSDEEVDDDEPQEELGEYVGPRDASPPSSIAPVWREIERNLETAADLFAKHAQECDEALPFRMGIRCTIIELQKYVEAVEKF